MHNKLQRLKQGSCSVDEYWKEMEMLLIRASMNELEEATMTLFLEGLNEDIQGRVEMHSYANLQELVHQALRCEQQLLRKTKGHPNSSKPTWKHQNQQDSGAGTFYKPSVSSESAPTFQRDAIKTVSLVSKTGSKAASNDVSTSTTSNAICHKCHGKGHKKDACPNKYTILVDDLGEHYSESEHEQESDKVLL